MQSNILKPLVSIIVPIYNAEDYVHDCLESISMQTYKNLQIILIDDGSTDSSGEIAKSYAVRDSRVVLISQENSGVASARGAGLRSATGEFIIHADSDDILPLEAIDSLYHAMMASGADIVLGDYVVRNARNDLLVALNFAGEQGDLLKGMLTGKYHAGLWNKLIKKELYAGLHFEPRLDFMEDMLILTKILMKDHVKIFYAPKTVYIYKQRSGSYTNAVSERSLTASGIVTEKICGMLESKYSQEFIRHIRNRNRLMVLLNSNNKKNILAADKNILDDREIPIRLRFVLWFVLRGVSFPLKVYNYFKSVVRPVFNT